MESELGFDDFLSGSESEDAEGACQNVEVFSSSSSDMKSLETGTLNSPEIEVFSSPDTEKSTPMPFRRKVLGLTLAPTPLKFYFIDQKSDFKNFLLIVLNAGLLERFSETIT